jgi:hypothetical protein
MYTLSWRTYMRRCVCVSLLSAPSTRFPRREVDGVVKRLHVICTRVGARVLELATPRCLDAEAGPRSCVLECLRLRDHARLCRLSLAPLHCRQSGACLHPWSRCVELSIFPFRGRVRTTPRSFPRSRKP